jgi:HlyD family secretion protein
MGKRKKSKLKRWIVICIILIAVVGLGARYVVKNRVKPYDNITAATGDITTYYSFSGNIDTKNRQTVISEKPMQISEIDVKEGDTVKEGDVLLKTTTGDEIKAEIDGEVTNLNVEENAQIMAGIKLMDIVDYNNLEVQVKVDEYDISAVEVGKETTVNIGALNKKIKGTVSSMSKEGQVLNGVTYFIATIDLEPDASLRIGMSAEVKMANDTASGVVTLPMTAIQFDANNNPYVFKKGAKKNNYIKTEITTGINDGTAVEIKSGVSSGEVIYYPDNSTANGNFSFRGGRNSNNNGGDNN